jgi:Rad54 N terminal
MYHVISRCCGYPNAGGDAPSILQILEGAVSEVLAVTRFLGRCWRCLNTLFWGLVDSWDKKMYDLVRRQMPTMYLLMLTISRQRPRPAAVVGKGTPQKAARFHGPSEQSAERLSKPFKCPGTATATVASNRPSRKRRKVDYTGADGSVDEDYNRPWTTEERLALANRDVNKFGIFKVKDKDMAFKQRFSVPLINKNAGGYDASRPAPTLGMRRGATFVVKPLHDPSGEFAIVLYDPTVDDKPAKRIEETDNKAEEPTNLDEPLVHKSLADILGLKKKVEERPKVPVVIDPRLSKVLRPHQIEGVKVSTMLRLRCFFRANNFGEVSLSLHNGND